jgi:hypothetical protein
MNSNALEVDEDEVLEEDTLSEEEEDAKVLFNLFRVAHHIGGAIHNHVRAIGGAVHKHVVGAIHTVGLFVYGVAKTLEGIRNIIVGQIFGFIKWQYKDLKLDEIIIDCAYNLVCYQKCSDFKGFETCKEDANMLLYDSEELDKELKNKQTKNTLSTSFTSKITGFVNEYGTKASKYVASTFRTKISKKNL